MSINFNIYCYIRYFLCVAICSGVWSISAVAQSELESRIEFGNEYVSGQSLNSGAVYLTNRKPIQLKSMLRERVSYRDNILNDYTHIDYFPLHQGLQR